MFDRSLKYYLGIFLFIIVSAFPADSQIPNPSQPEVQTADNLIHYGDLIEVDVVGSVEYDWRGTLNPEGFLEGVEFIEEPVYALCQTEQTIVQAFVKGLEKFLRNPQVNVRILDKSNRALSVFNGAVKKPQKFRIKRVVYLNELLILSGGLTDTMNGEIRIFRPLNLSCEEKKAGVEPENSTNGLKRDKFVKTGVVNGSKIFNIRVTDLLAGNKESNPQILSGDLITVLEAAPVYVIGGVNRPKQIPYRAEMTITRAIDTAGGISKDALKDSITVFRRNGRETKTLNFDYDKIKNGQTEDLLLQPFDIVDVGQKGKEKKKIPPVINTKSDGNAKIINLPLTIID